MPAMIWDETLQAFKEATTPKIWNESINAFVDSEGKAYNGSEWVDAYGDLPGTSIIVGQDYTLGSGAHTNTNGTIKVKCLSKSSSTAVMQTYGITAGAWPGDGDLTSSYRGYFGNLASAISGVRLATGTTTSNITPSGSYDPIFSSAKDSYSFNADTTNKYSWLSGSRNISSGSVNYWVAWAISSSGSVRESTTTNNHVSAPYFILNLTNIKIKKDGTIVIR